VEEIRKHVFVKFHPFSDSLYRIDELNVNKNSILTQIAFITLINYRDKYNSLPSYNDHASIEEFKRIYRSNFQLIKIDEEYDVPEINIDKEDQMISCFAKFCQLSLAPFCTYLGGIIAQEILKFSGLYIPLTQWYHYEIFSAVPCSKNVTLKGNKNDHQIIIFGDEVQQNIEKSK
jgi:ubiquitin-activating enzyme E1